MTAGYLPKNATCTESCDWLKVQTGDNWTLARLLEHGLMPWFWLDYKPGYPAIFGDHIEGYLAPMVFAGDMHRLEADGSHAFVNLTRAHDGAVVKIEPSITVPIKELKFKREELQALSSALKKHASTVDDDATTSSRPASDDKLANETYASYEKKWTANKLAELKAYRKSNTMKDTAKKFGISEQRIRKLLSNEMPQKNMYSGLTHRMK